MKRVARVGGEDHTEFHISDNLGRVWHHMEQKEALSLSSGS